MCVVISVGNQTETQTELSAGFSSPLALAVASAPPRSLRGGDRPVGEGGVVLAPSLGLTGM